MGKIKQLAIEAAEQKEFESELTNLVNRYSLGSGSNTPDYILAQYIRNSLNDFNAAVNMREEWYGRNQIELS